MKILLSNDDGFLAPGIRCLKEALDKVGNVVMVAPDRNRSGVSNSLTLDRPLKAVEHNPGEYSVNGTPTDCVHMAVYGLLSGERPDIVVSGINEGSNVSDDVLYSGTVAAAMEGRFLGLPAIAVSLRGEKCEHYATAAAITKQVLEKIIREPMLPGAILNINVPDLPLEEIKGIQVTRLGTRHKAQDLAAAKDPRGNTVYWVGLPGGAQDAGAGTDFWAVDQGYVSVTPLQVDLTKYDSIDDLKAWFSDF